MKPLMLLLVLLLASACSVMDALPLVGPTQSSNANLRITNDHLDGLIFTAENAAQSGVSFVMNSPVLEYWTPTEMDILSLEDALVPYLQQELTPDHYAYKIIDDLPRYKRQYLGITLIQGQPLIYANYFCTEVFDNWQDHFVVVDDGGACFFQVIYDPLHKTFSQLSINGFA